MAGYGGGHPQECPLCGEPPWESCGRGSSALPCGRHEQSGGQHVIKTISLKHGQTVKQRLRGGVLETRHEITVWDDWGAESIIPIRMQTTYCYDITAEHIIERSLNLSYRICAGGEPWKTINPQRVEDEQIRAALRASTLRVLALARESNAARHQSPFPYGFKP